MLENKKKYILSNLFLSVISLHGLFLITCLVSSIISYCNLTINPSNTTGTAWELFTILEHLRSSPNIRRVCVASLYLLCLFTLVIVCFCLFLIISDIYFTSVNTGMKRRFEMKIQQNMWPMVNNLSENFYKKNMLHSLNTIYLFYKRTGLSFISVINLLKSMY